MGAVKRRQKELSVRHFPLFNALMPKTAHFLGLVEALGRFLEELARRITVLTGEKLAFKFLKQKLDLAIQRGISGCILEAFS